MRSFYLLAAIVGAVVPYVFFFQQFADTGVDLASFVSALFATPAASGFTADLLISSFVFWAWMLARRNRPGGAPAPGLFVVLNLTIGLSCALPAYLWVASGAEEPTGG